MAGQAGSDALGGLYKSARRSFDKGNQQQLDKDLFAREDSLAQKNIESAREDGGFELDTADAYASISRQEGILGDVALADKKQAARPIDSTLHTFNSEQDAAIRDKAFELTRKLSNTSSEISLEDAGDGIKSALKDIKQSDFARASEKYDLWAETAEAQTIPLNVENVKGDLDKLLRETSARFDKSTSSSLRDTLGYYGLLGDNAQEVLTAGNYEKLLQDINRKWNPNASGSQNEPISLVHDFLRERQPNILAGTSDIPQEAIALGRAAAENWKLVSQKWNANEIAQKLTTTKKKSDDDTLTGFAAATHLLNPRKVSDLQKLKGLLQLDKNESSQKAWAGIQQAPLFKAIREATKGKDSFDAAAFSSVIDSYGYKTLETLYGKSQFLELKKAISAWNLRGKKLPVGSSLAEQSNGIVNAVANLSVRILSSTGLLRNGGQVALAAPSVNNALSRKLAVDKQEVNSEALISGQQTIRQLDKRREEVLKAYEDILGEDSFLRFQPYAAALARAYSREGNE